MTTEVEVTKDQRTATAEGESAQSLISGVLLRRQPPLEDERGEIVEVYRPSWGSTRNRWFTSTRSAFDQGR